MKKARILAAVMATALMTGAMPVSPIAEYFDSNVITASAETNVVQWDKNKIRDCVKSWSISSVVFLDHKPENGTVKTVVSVSSDGSIVAGPASDTSGIMYIWSADGGKVIAPADCSRLFHNMQTLTSIDLSGLNTSNVSDMSLMFESCVNLNNLDLSGFDTSRVTTINNMFYNSGIKTINLGDFDTSNVTDMHGVFRDCNKLTDLDLSSFDTSKVTDMSYMFNGCSALTEIDLSSFDTGKVTYMNYMFNGCSALTEIVLRSFDTKNVADMSYMFYDCEGLIDLDLSNFDTRNVADMSFMFYDCEGLIDLDLSNFDTRNVENMSYMFYHCHRLSELDLNSFDTSKVADMSNMFFNCYLLSELEIWNFTVNEGTDTSYFCTGCSRLKHVGCTGTEDILKKLGIRTDVVKSISVDGYSVDITNGSFMLNIYIKHSTEIAASSLAFVRFQVPNGTKKENIDIRVSDGVSKTVEGKTYLVYSVPVSAKDMRRDVAVEFHADKAGTILDTVNVSIEKYAKTLAKRNPDYDNFVSSMLTYGFLADCYFSNPDDYSSFPTHLNPDLIPTSAGITDENYVGSSLLLKDKITLRHYFNTKVDGASKKGNLWYVEKAFNPTEFDQKIEGYDYTVYNYIKKVLEGNYDYNLKYLCFALYKYNQAALNLVKSN